MAWRLAQAVTVLCAFHGLFTALASATTAHGTFTIHFLSLGRQIDWSRVSWKQDLMSCAIEAAVRVAQGNPGVRVVMHASEAEEWKLKDAQIFEPIDAHLEYRHLDLDALFGDTPFQQYWANGEWQEYRHALTTLSDAARIVLVHRLGGMYLDSDIILLDARVLPPAAQGRLSLEQSQYHGLINNNCAFSFSAGSPFTMLWMEAWMKSCPKDLEYGQCGPAMLTGLYRSTCLETNEPAPMCEDIHQWQPYDIAPLAWTNITRFTAVTTEQEWQEILALQPKALHWYSSAHPQTMTCLKKSSVLERAMAQACPLVHREYGPRHWCPDLTHA